MTIRIMTIEDYDAIYALWAATPGVGLRPVEDSREGIDYYLKRNPASCFVAEEDGAVAGTALCGNEGRRGFLSHVVVARDYRCRGIGKALVEACLTALRAEGIRQCVLVALRRNDEGIAFWKAIGFSERDDLFYLTDYFGE